jgi:hypothetical protein
LSKKIFYIYSSLFDFFPSSLYLHICFFIYPCINFSGTARGNLALYSEVTAFDIGTKTWLISRPLRKIEKSDYQLRHVRLSAWTSSAPTGRIFMKLDI